MSDWEKVNGLSAMSDQPTSAKNASISCWGTSGFMTATSPGRYLRRVVNARAQSEWIIWRTGHALQDQTQYAGHLGTSPGR